MPDHIHLFVAGTVEFDLGIWIRGLKRSLNSQTGTWQPGFFDHILRNNDSYDEKWNYVYDNPVRAGLVRARTEWRFAGEIVDIDRV